MEIKMSKIALALSLVLVCLAPGYSLAEWPANHWRGEGTSSVKARNPYENQQNVNHVNEYKAKVSHQQAVYGNIVIGHPVTDLGLKYYYAVKDPYGNPEEVLSEAEIEKLAERMAEKTANRVVAKLIDKLKNDLDNDKPANPDGKVPGGNTKDKQAIEAKVTSIFKARCYNCHATETKASGGYTLLTNDTLNKFNREEKWDIFDAVDTQRMPMTGEPLTVQEIEDIRAYARLKD
jgi:hypothetical protein